MADLGRFGHHPDPAIDFCIEVECIEGEAFNERRGIPIEGPPIDDRIFRAMQFRTGGDAGAIKAKELLREIEKARRPSPAVEGGWRFKRGAYVRKVVGSKWNGRVVGFYTTELTQRGYAVESMYEIGSVQIYPEKALELFSVAPTPPAGEKS